jgi:hypothetical protein
MLSMRGRWPALRARAAREWVAAGKRLGFNVPIGVSGMLHNSQILKGSNSRLGDNRLESNDRHNFQWKPLSCQEASNLRS